ncbi:MAG: hypothetical protein WC508_00310 [Patescibacteria group bacterium]
MLYLLVTLYNQVAKGGPMRSNKTRTKKTSAKSNTGWAIVLGFVIGLALVVGAIIII